MTDVRPRRAGKCRWWASADGIPPTDEPTFEPAKTVTWLDPEEPVFSLTAADRGETRAYPLRTITWHNIVARIPVAVT